MNNRVACIQRAYTGIQRFKSNPLLSTTSEASSTRIQAAIEDYFGIPFADLNRNCRERKIAFPRQISMYLHTRETRYTKVQIGKMHGGRDHTTVLHSQQLISDCLTMRFNSPEKTELLTFLDKYGF